MTGKLGDSDVTQVYEDYLRSVGKKADSLPSFLSEDRGIIYMGVLDDSDVTEAWEEWVNTLKPIEAQEE